MGYIRAGFILVRAESYHMSMTVFSPWPGESDRDSDGSRRTETSAMWMRDVLR